MAIAGKLFACLAAALGASLIGSGALDYWEVTQAQRWPSVKAIVLSSSVNSWRGSKGSKSFMPCVSYKYSVGDETLIGHAIRFGPSVVDRNEAEDAVSRFPVGAQTVAYFDPNDHKRSVLDREHLSGAVKRKTGCGIGFLVAGVVLLIALRRPSRVWQT